MRPALYFLVSAALFAQTEAPKPANRVIGEVVSKDPASREFVVKTDGGVSYTVGFSDATNFLRVPPGEKDLTKAAKINSGDVETGDRVLARGEVSEDQKRVTAKSLIVMTKTDLALKHERDRAEWQKRGVAGAVTAVDPAANQITITTRAREGTQPLKVVSTSTTAFRRYAPDSIHWDDAKPSSIAEIKTGDQVRVLGTKNADGTEVTAEQVVSGSFRTIAGTVVSVDPQAGEIRMNDLELKKPVSVKVSSDHTTLRRLPPMAAMMLARRLNPTFQMPEGAGLPGGAAGSRPGGAAGPGATPLSQRGAGVATNRDATGGTEHDERSIPAPLTADDCWAQYRQYACLQRFNGKAMLDCLDEANAFLKNCKASVAAGGRGTPAGRVSSFGGGANGGDLGQMIERMPAFGLAELKPGDALIVSSTEGAERTRVNAITILAGVEPILQAAPRSFGQAGGVGSWNLEMSIPMQ